MQKSISLATGRINNGNKFRESVTMKLKFYTGKILIHLVDDTTRLSPLILVKSKMSKKNY